MPPTENLHTGLPQKTMPGPLAMKAALRALLSPWALTAILTGAVLRMAWFFFHPHDICWDELVYYQVAQNIAAGDPIGLPFFTPGWYLIAGWLFALFGVHIRLAFALNTAASIATVALAGLLAGELFGRRVMLISLWITALMPSYILSGDLFLYQPLLQLFLVACAWLGLRGRWSWSTVAAIGLLSGAAALMRPFWMVLPALLWAGARLRQVEKTALARALLAQGLAAALVLGWVAYTSSENGRLIPVSLNSTLNFWMVNNPKATGTHVAPPDSSYFDPNNEPKVREEALAYFREHPWQSVSLIPQKLYFMFYREALVNWVFAQTRFPLPPGLVSGIRGAADLSYWFVLAASLAGTLLLAARRQFRGLILAGLLLYNTLSYMPFTGQLIYRWPAQFVMILYSAVLLDELTGLAARRIQAAQPAA